MNWIPFLRTAESFTLKQLWDMLYFHQLLSLIILHHDHPKKHFLTGLVGERSRNGQRPQSFSFRQFLF